MSSQLYIFDDDLFFNDIINININALRLRVL